MRSRVIVNGKPGEAVGFKKTGGFTLAFTEHEAELLYERQALKADAGADYICVQ